MSPVTRRPLWRNHDYLAWLLADTSWQFGASIRAFAMTLITYDVTQSAAQAGLVATASTVVSTVATLPGGVLVDRWDRRRSLTVSAVARVVVFSAAAIAWWAGAMTLPVLYAVGGLAGLIGGLFGTASNAALKSVVPTEDLPRATAANQGRDGAVELAAAPLSGLLMAVSNALPFVAAALGSLLQAVATRVIRADLRPSAGSGAGDEGGPSCPARDTPGDHSPAPPVRPTRPGYLGRTVREMAEGFRVVLDTSLLRRLFPASICINCGLGALFVGLQLIMRADGVPAWQIGLLDSALAVGLLIGAVFASRLIATVPTGVLSVTLFVLAAAVLVPASLTQSVPVALVSFFLLGLMMPALNGAVMGYTQAVIPSDLQGRALSAFAVVGQTLPALMPAAVGLGLQHVGAGPTMLAATATFPVAALLIVTHSELRALPTPDRWDIPAVHGGRGAAATVEA